MERNRKTKLAVDLNCDLGEGLPNDKEVMAFISSANISCGYHAGDADTMRRTIDLAIENNVTLGAHPGYHDKENFGRVPKNLTSNEVYDLVLEQLDLFRHAAQEAGGVFRYVKPHGALYNQAAKDLELARIIVRAIKDLEPKLALMAMANSQMEEAAQESDLLCLAEVFADRAYDNDGFLMPRSVEGAVIYDGDFCADRVVQMVQKGTVRSYEGKVINLKADSICIHGDNREAIALASRIHESLLKNEIKITSCWD